MGTAAPVVAGVVIALRIAAAAANPATASPAAKQQMVHVVPRTRTHSAGHGRREVAAARVASVAAHRLTVTMAVSLDANRSLEGLQLLSVALLRSLAGLHRL